MTWPLILQQAGPDFHLPWKTQGAKRVPWELPGLLRLQNLPSVSSTSFYWSKQFTCQPRLSRWRSRSPQALNGRTATGKAERRWDSLRFTWSHCYNHQSLCQAEHKPTSDGTTCGILLKVFRMTEMAKRCPDAQETGYYTCKVSWPVSELHTCHMSHGPIDVFSSNS